MSYVGLPIKPQFKQNIEHTYAAMQGDKGFVWGTQQLHSVPKRSDANTVVMAPYANVTNCGYLPTNRPYYNQAGPAWYRQPRDDAQNMVNYTLESIRRVHSQTHLLLRVSNHTATGIESLATLQGMQQVPLPEPIKQTIELLTDFFNDLLSIVFDLEFKLRYVHAEIGRHPVQHGQTNRATNVGAVSSTAAYGDSRQIAHAVHGER